MRAIFETLMLLALAAACCAVFRPRPSPPILATPDLAAGSNERPPARHVNAAGAVVLDHGSGW